MWSFIQSGIKIQKRKFKASKKSKIKISSYAVNIIYERLKVTKKNVATSRILSKFI